MKTFSINLELYARSLWKTDLLWCRKDGFARLKHCYVDGRYRSNLPVWHNRRVIYYKDFI